MARLVAGDVSQDRREGLVRSGRIPFGAQQHRYVEVARMDDEIIKAADEGRRRPRQPGAVLMALDRSLPAKDRLLPAPDDYHGPLAGS